MVGFSLHNADAMSFLSSLPNESVDLIVTDPPYSTLEKHRKVGTTTRLRQSKSSSNQWFPVIDNSMFEPIFYQMYRVLKKHAHCYVMCDEESTFDFRPQTMNVGFKYWKSLVWDRQVIGMGYHYRNQTERIMCMEKDDDDGTDRIIFLEKGKRRLHNLGIPDILSVRRVYKGYPTEKPVELNRILIEQSSSPGDVVVDPFMGSGSCGEAALLCGRNFIGCDIVPDAVNVARKRLSELGVAEERQVAMHGQMSFVL